MWNRRSVITAAATLPAFGLFPRLVVAQASEIRVGLLLSISGPAAFLGVSNKNAADLIVDQINAKGGISGKKVRLFFYDTESNNTLVAQQYRRLVESDNVNVVLGPTTTGESLVARPLATEMKVPTILFGGAETLVVPPQEHVFKVTLTDRTCVQFILSYVQQKKMKSVAILYSADGFGQAGAKIVKDLAATMNIPVATSEEFGPRDSDMTPQLLRIRSSGVEAVIVWSVNPGPSVILRNAKAIGYTIPIINSYGVASEQFITQSGAAGEGGYVASSRVLAPEGIPDADPMKKAIMDFAQAYKDRFKEALPAHNASPYDAFLALQKAVEVAGGQIDRNSITAAMNSGKVEFNGFNGQFHFTSDNHNGLGPDSSSWSMLQIKNQKFVGAA